MAGWGLRLPQNRPGAYFRMRRNLAEPIAPAPLASGYSFIPFGPENGPACRALMNAVYARGFGDEMDFEAWWPWLTKDSDFDPALVFVVARGDAVVGVCHAWTGSFVKDIVVDPAHRGAGIASAMLTRTFEALAARGHGAVDLKVDVENLPAQSVYRRLGFAIVERVDRTLTADG
jgi:ribosomal protein S18 acetylase RimI-like enzyme